ncbi:MAG: tRNA 2-selenouridine(34) synthase MnmH [Bacilli bacterium]|nr:tRNA 2-selenouridine(34) synthase MnmH [Bacilli bacterium]
MDNTIDVETLINNKDKYLIIDVRSPLEYKDGTIKDAINIPILDNDERKQIGTLYKENKNEAYRLALEILSRKLLYFYDEVNKLKMNNPNKRILFFCFRGGLRSKSIQSIINLKVPVYRLEGGYKAYRRYLLDNLPIYSNKVNWLVLTGNTGSGKTIILEELQNRGYPVIDLEKLANNRGSIFGSIGMGDKVNQKVFDSELFFELKNYIDKNITYIFIESESRKIGNVILPEAMHNKMKSSPHIMLNVSIDKRIKIIKDMYDLNNIDKDNIKIIINNNKHFKERLGNKWLQQINNYLDESNYDEFIKRLMLDYYDKLYLESHVNYKYDLEITNDNEEKTIKQLISYYNNLKG